VIGSQIRRESHGSKLRILAVDAKPVIADEVDAHARRLVLAHGWNATAYQILNPGISHWFSRDGDAVVGFVRCAGTRVVAGAPVCAGDRLAAVVEEFSASAAVTGERVCYFGAGDRLERHLVPTGRWSAASLGAQPSWDPHRWPSILERRASLRAQLNRARNKGVQVTEWDAERARGSAELRASLDEWLASRHLPPLHFLVESDTLGRLEDRRVFVAASGSSVLGFLLASPIPARNGWLVEQIIRGRRAPNGTAELLLDAAMRSLAASGVTYVTLGLAPLSRHSRFDRRRMPLWLRFGLTWLRAHGRRFYNFEGLDRFKAKFDPDRWEEIVALSDAPRFPARALWAIAAAFSRGSPMALLARALGRAAASELARLTR
jgi:phosphatidylglycerol lysyltransferase